MLAKLYIYFIVIRCGDFRLSSYTCVFVSKAESGFKKSNIAKSSISREFYILFVGK